MSCVISAMVTEMLYLVHKLWYWAEIISGLVSLSRPVRHQTCGHLMLLPFLDPQTLTAGSIRSVPCPSQPDWPQEDHQFQTHSKLEQAAQAKLHLVTGLFPHWKSITAFQELNLCFFHACFFQGMLGNSSLRCLQDRTWIVHVSLYHPLMHM